MNVATPSSTAAATSASGASCCAVMTADRPKSTALSPAVAARHSAIPARSVRWAASLMPVPGLSKARKVVVPPNAAATESVKKRSGSSSDGIRDVRVDVDHARQHEQAGRVDDVRGGARREVRLDRDDAAVTDARRPPAASRRR